MTQVTSRYILEPELTQASLIVTTPDTKLAKVLFTATEFIKASDEILPLIEKDQDALGLRKKKKRLRDQKYIEEKNEKLSGMDVPATEYDDRGSRLEQGRSRMPAFQVFIFMLLRGYWGSIKASDACERMIDSTTLYNFFLEHNLSMPSVNAILDNINCLSVDTLKAIHQAQLAMIMEMDLDDFQRVYIDSTAVEANSAWPTDSRILLKLIDRIFRMSQNLEVFGLVNFGLHWVPAWLQLLRELNFQIDTLGNKRGSRRKRKVLYRKFLEKAEKALEYLYSELERANDRFCSMLMLPSKQGQLREVLDHVGTDIMDGLHVVYYASARVLNGTSISAADKILSIRDRTAAMIMKGGRDPILGYRVQIGRSENGFICGLDVPEGNISDVEKLIPTVKECIDQSTVIPSMISTDDGYSSKLNLDLLTELAVRYISMNGSKGKKIIDEQLWDSDEMKDARRNRSAIEGLIGTLKNRYGFGQLRRWGLKAVTSELMETAIVYNFCRMVDLGAAEQIRRLKAAA